MRVSLSRSVSVALRTVRDLRYLSVIGFVINIDTLMLMIPELLQVQRYVLTYRFSQDHLELPFNSIRASGGWNNNPSARQFQAIFRRLMVGCFIMKKELLKNIIETKSKITVLADESTSVGHKSTLIVFLKASVDGDMEPIAFPLDLVELDNYPDGSNSSEYLVQPTTYLPENFTYAQNLPCPERLPSMKGLIEVNMTEIPMEEIELRSSKYFDIEFGGHWKPKDCRPRWKVAILIPFRNCHEHLPILFQHLIPMLQRQRLQFAFYVIEQSGSQPFNRAMLFNVGFLEAMKDLDWDCLIFHDVDHIPENDRNYYGCGQMPRHFAAKLDKYMYILPYSEFFGGVSGLTVEQFRKINGFPNAFWGWGGEDDDLWNSTTADPDTGSLWCPWLLLK
ncbi:beta-1,4-galactosyltransferase 6-like [Pseudochaenichthys georgianus]|uniref:beta-1,4-galactosyltransferase 6-like n=2 Tax=Pseudochaenichthys georgianus TaxID=52239 RepID=UPI0039C454DC